MGLKQRMAVALLPLLFVMVSLGLMAKPAGATSTFVWNNRGSYVPAYYAPTSQTYVKEWLRNGTRFQMSCYVDWQWYYGNYSTNRWFWGQSYATGAWEYINASYVYYQTWVPPC